jgi:hypothetical protein
MILMFVLLPLAMSAQSPLDAFFDKKGGEKGYQTVIYGKRMLDIMKEDASPDTKALLKRIRTIRIISSQKASDDIIRIARQDVRESRKYETISQINENGSLSEFHISENIGKAKDVSFVMIVSSSQGSAVVEIIGEFDVKDISRLSVIGQKK